MGQRARRAPGQGLDHSRIAKLRFLRSPAWEAGSRSGGGRPRTVRQLSCPYRDTCPHLHHLGFSQGAAAAPLACADSRDSGAKCHLKTRGVGADEGQEKAKAARVGDKLVKSSGDPGIFPILGLRTIVYSLSVWRGDGR